MYEQWPALTERGMTSKPYITDTGNFEGDKYTIECPYCSTIAVQPVMCSNCHHIYCKNCRDFLNLNQADMC